MCDPQLCILFAFGSKHAGPALKGNADLPRIGGIDFRLALNKVVIIGARFLIAALFRIPALSACRTLLSDPLPRQFYPHSTADNVR